jgi:competence protein ComEA
MIKILITLLLFISLAFGAVNINHANSTQLQTLNGIGPTKADEILKYRKIHGSFNTVDELVNVKGLN